jgi:acyl-CoA synthetase (AMP-forming)/AMP-acid ligase II
VNLAHILADGAVHHPERTALPFEGERISYRELPESATGKILNRSIDLGSLRERLPRRPAP